MMFRRNHGSIRRSAYLIENMGTVLWMTMGTMTMGTVLDDNGDGSRCHLSGDTENRPKPLKKS